MKIFTSLSLLLISASSFGQSFPVKTEVGFFDARLYDQPVRSETEFTEVTKGSSITVLEITQEPWLKVDYNNRIGYMSFVHFKDNDEISELYYADIYSDDPKMKRLMESFGAVTSKKIANGEYWIGMTDKMAIESLGKPSDNNKSVGSWGTHEQWIYKGKNLYLYFENGVLASYQEN
jgi:hypothetical protein